MTTSQTKISDYRWIIFDKRRRMTIAKALSAGAAYNILAQKPFMLHRVVRTITVTSDLKSTIISKRRQLSFFKRVWINPFLGPYTYVISSVPNEIRGQMVAMRLFLRAIDLMEKKNVVWHPVLGGISHDALRDNQRNMDIGFLILSNVPDNCTPYKLEKLRDILTIYSSIPKIIVATGLDPVAFMSDLVKMPANFVTYLGAKKEVQQL